MHPPQASNHSEADRGKAPRVTPEIASEAAVWIARLHGPDRSRDMEQECLAWQSRSPMHRLAFERCTETWQAAPAITVSAYAGATTRDRGCQMPVSSRRAVLASVGAGCAALLGWRLWPGKQAYETGVGQRRIVMLADGTRMTLNTSTEVQVDMTRAQRTVSVPHGEALFEVAKEPGRPLVVRVSGVQVVATGTAFLVRSLPGTGSGDGSFDVTLIEGQVVVQRTDTPAPTAPIVMAPGERLQDARLQDGAKHRPVHLDRPQIDKLMAWQRGEAVFDNTPLSDAVAEMNRYSQVQIALVGEGAGALRISGLHRTGDSESFARSVAQLHGLTLRTVAGRFELAAR